MIVDGKAIAEKMYQDTREMIEGLSRAPHFTIITCNPNFETKKYLALKERKAKALGIVTHIVELPSHSTTEDFVTTITEAVNVADGIIVQLPLPPDVDSEVVMCAIPTTHDADALNPNTTTLLSPVVGACKAILDTHHIVVAEKFVTVVGSGKLVGLPMYHWFVAQGAHVSVVTKDTHEIEHYTKQADIILCGAGAPGLLQPTMIKDGVVILDAGTSEEGGELRGDADPTCAEKASIFTPVPGGVGPITIAILLQNVVYCAQQRGV